MSTFRSGWMITKVIAQAHHNSLIFCYGPEINNIMDGPRTHQ
jgi:hypothetical protein